MIWPHLEAWQERYPVYLRASSKRRRELDTTIAADRALMDRIADLQVAHLHQLVALPAAARPASI